MKSLFLSFSLFCLFVPKSFSQDFDEGLKAFDAKDYKKSFELLMPYAEKGSCLAQFVIGYSYQYGKSVNVDSTLAIRWLTMSSQQKQPNAMGPLAVLLFARNDRRQEDIIQAYMWSMLAAEYLDSQKYKTTRFVIKAYMKEPEIQKGDKLIEQYKAKWQTTTDCR